ncbi:hypothetical protein ATY75_10160 [Rhizobium sp. N122]|nr:hypothetical protein ATY75_10160 [Rhizobium sp. N122]
MADLLEVQGLNAWYGESHILHGVDMRVAGMGLEDVGVVSAIIRDVARDRAVLMVEHNLSVVANICQHVTVLQRGEILAEGDYATVSQDERVRVAYMGTEEH